MQDEHYKIVTIQTLQPREIPAQSSFDGAKLWNEGGKRRLLTYEETCKPTQPAQFQNGFFGAFLLAYNNHGEVKITPDDVWLTIMLYFSQYVKNNSEQLRSAFVSHQGKKSLEVKTYNQLSENQWDEFFTLMIEEIKINTTKDVTSKLECDFSTTSRIQKLLSTAVIMNTYKNYFEYDRCIPGCGIQKVHFGGTLKDWKWLKTKTEQLSSYDVNGLLKTYVKEVVKIIDEFIETYEERPNIDFWNRVVNREVGPLGSGKTHYYTGWIIHFFGYPYDTRTEEVKMDSIDVDLKLINQEKGEEKQVKMVGGFLAVSQEGKVYRPHLSMAILDDVGEPKKYWRFKCPCFC